MLVSPPSRTMDQDEKVSAAALQLSIASTRPGRVGSASEIGFGGSGEVGAGEVVGSASAMGPGIETDEGSSDLPASHATDEKLTDEKPTDEKPTNDGATDHGASAKPSRASTASEPPKKVHNNVRKIRIERMMSKAELARRANLSVLTIDRVERGYGCRMDTKRKLLEALGLSLADRVRVFGEEE